MASTPKTTLDTTAWANVGTNLKMHMLDGFIFLAIPVPTDKSKLPMTKDKALPGGGIKPSTNRQVASSHGNITIPGTDIKLGVNAYTPAV